MAGPGSAGSADSGLDPADVSAAQREQRRDLRSPTRVNWWISHGNLDTFSLTADVTGVNTRKDAG